jgi:hypothetical protein
MSYLTPEENKGLENCKTVADMLKFLTETFDLNIYPQFLTKVIIINGLKSAIDLLKPVRKTQVTINLKPKP